MKNNLFLLLIFFAVFLEATITTLPLTICLLLIFYILKKDSVIFFLAFLAGILLDILLLRSMGLSSAVFVGFLFVVFLYESKFEIETFAFVFFASFLGSFLYLLMIGYDSSLLQSVVAAFCSSLFFWAMQRFRLKMSKLA